MKIIISTVITSIVICGLIFNPFSVLAENSAEPWWNDLLTEGGSANVSPWWDDSVNENNLDTNDDWWRAYNPDVEQKLVSDIETQLDLIIKMINDSTDISEEERVVLLDMVEDVQGRISSLKPSSGDLAYKRKNIKNITINGDVRNLSANVTVKFGAEKDDKGKQLSSKTESYNYSYKPSKQSLDIVDKLYELEFNLLRDLSDELGTSTAMVRKDITERNYKLFANASEVQAHVRKNPKYSGLVNLAGVYSKITDIDVLVGSNDGMHVNIETDQNELTVLNLYPNISHNDNENPYKYDFQFYVHGVLTDESYSDDATYRDIEIGAERVLSGVGRYFDVSDAVVAKDLTQYALKNSSHYTVGNHSFISNMTSQCSITNKQKDAINRIVLFLTKDLQLRDSIEDTVYLHVRIEQDSESGSSYCYADNTDFFSNLR
ncbi:hypothetical protein KC865_01620 [Candidatus Kaiserbacteria bacterium]|nr:hypothetical protein [Candidatus Kaiserbacteria bacterium]